MMLRQYCFTVFCYLRTVHHIYFMVLGSSCTGLSVISVGMLTVISQLGSQRLFFFFSSLGNHPTPLMPWDISVTCHFCTDDNRNSVSINQSRYLTLAQTLLICWFSLTSVITQPYCAVGNFRPVCQINSIWALLVVTYCKVKPFLFTFMIFPD